MTTAFIINVLILRQVIIIFLDDLDEVYVVIFIVKR